jgi:hypothetical protein
VPVLAVLVLAVFLAPSLPQYRHRHRKQTDIIDPKWTRHLSGRRDQSAGKL